MYTPAKTASYEAVVRKNASDAMEGIEPLQGPVKLTLSIVFPLPKSKRATRNRPAPTWHTSKPDASNVLKAVEDAMNGIVYRDDSQVASASIVKVYSDDGSSRLVVQVEEL